MAPTVSSIGVRHVDAVLVVEVDVVDAETLERGVAGPVHVLRRTVDPHPGAVLAALVPELRRDDDLFAPARDRLADEALVRERAVHVGRVQEGDAQIEGAMDRGDCPGLVGGPVELGHAHTAEAEGGDCKAFAAERAGGEAHADTVDAWARSRSRTGRGGRTLRATMPAP